MWTILPNIGAEPIVARCEICSLETRKTKMNRHLREVHSIGLVIHRCPRCNKEFKRKYKFNEHIVMCIPNLQIGQKLPAQRGVRSSNPYWENCPQGVRSSSPALLRNFPQGVSVTPYLVNYKSWISNEAYVTNKRSHDATEPFYWIEFRMYLTLDSNVVDL